MKFLVLLFGILPSLAFAQMYPGELELRPRIKTSDDFSLFEAKSSQRFPYSVQQIEMFSRQWGEQLKSQFEKVKLEGTQNSDPACAARGSFLKLRSMYVSGLFEDAVQFAESCGKNLNQSAGRYAALSALGLADQKKAVSFFQLATRDPKLDTNEFKATLLVWAGWKLDRKVLAKYPDWSERQQKLLYNGILISQRLTFDDDVKLEDYLSFYKGEFAVAAGAYQHVLFTIEARRKYLESEDDLYELVQQYGPQFEDPTLWARLAYRMLFNTPTPMFKKASLVYEATLPYLHARAAMPVEDNVKNYSELYSTDCKTSLTQGEVNRQFFALKAQWRDGKISTDQLEESVAALASGAPAKADLLVAQATFAHMRGDMKVTRELAWQAHQLCPYFNRAHWILASLMDTDKYKSYEEYPQLRQNMKDVVAATEVPNEVATYIINWKQLTKDAQENLIWGLRLWIKYVPGMDQNNYRAYIKFPFEMMYEVPTLSRIKDERVSYPRDNRLWDDTRGLGGQTIVADYFQAPEAPYGNYNLLGHEAAHQLDDYLESFFNPAYQCLNNLFADATERDVFVTPYARLRAEYFAVGSEAYFIPEGYPARFGVQRSWYKTNDLKLATFLEEIVKGPDVADRMNCQ